MGGNNEFFENFEKNKYLKKLPSMQRVKGQIKAAQGGVAQSRQVTMGGPETLIPFLTRVSGHCLHFKQKMPIP